MLVFAGGPALPAVTSESGLPPVGEVALVVAADAGLHHAHAAGFVADVIVGDFDSVDPALLEQAEADGALVERHPPDKDKTDLELALDVALGSRPDRVVVVAGLDGRADHALAGALLLASPTYGTIPVVEAHLGDAHVHVVRSGRPVVLRGRPGDLVSLIPVHGRAEAVRTDGLRFGLDRETLEAGSTRGVSNELLGEEATVRLDWGVLLAVQPGSGARTGQLSTDHDPAGPRTGTGSEDGEPR